MMLADVATTISYFVIVLGWGFNLLRRYNSNVIYAHYRHRRQSKTAKGKFCTALSPNITFIAL
jgi:hypothetical protein